MLLDVSLLDQDTALVAHVARRRTGVLIIVTIVLNCESLTWGLPVATDRELLGVITGPDLDLVDVTVTETSILHSVSKGLTITVVTFLAEKKILFSADEDFEVSHEVLG